MNRVSHEPVEGPDFKEFFENAEIKINNLTYQQEYVKIQKDSIYSTTAHLRNREEHLRGVKLFLNNSKLEEDIDKEIEDINNLLEKLNKFEILT